MIPPDLAAEVERLVGQTVEVGERDYRITDIAGEGVPIVGVVERRDGKLWLAGLELVGPLAHPRLAGPGYKVWVIGEVKGAVIRAKRIGVLRAPVL